MFVCMYVYMYVCLLITFTRSPKAELRRAQLSGDLLEISCYQYLVPQHVLETLN